MAAALMFQISGGKIFDPGFRGSSALLMWGTPPRTEAFDDEYFPYLHCTDLSLYAPELL